MPRRSGALAGLSAVALLAAGSLSFAAEEVKQDSIVAAEYKTEATQLRDSRWLIEKLASWYAAWCTQRMVDDAVTHFAVRPISNESLAQR